LNPMGGRDVRAMECCIGQPTKSLRQQILQLTNLCIDAHTLIGMSACRLASTGLPRCHQIDWICAPHLMGGKGLQLHLTAAWAGAELTPGWLRLSSGSCKPASQAACGHRDPASRVPAPRSGTPGIPHRTCSPPWLRRTIQIQERKLPRGETDGRTGEDDRRRDGRGHL
jgi:hypothetical protein